MPWTLQLPLSLPQTTTRRKTKKLQGKKSIIKVVNKVSVYSLAIFGFFYNTIGLYYYSSFSFSVLKTLPLKDSYGCFWWFWKMEENIGHKQTIKTEPLAPSNNNWRAQFMPTIRQKIVIFFLHTTVIIFIFLFNFLIFFLNFFLIQKRKKKVIDDIYL